MNGLQGKVALITGGSKGIGAALSERLAGLGASVIINYSSDSHAADKLVQKINGQHNGKAMSIKADAASVDGAEHMIDAAIDMFGKLNILVPCAGILPMRTLDNTTEQDFDKTFALNVKGPFFLAQVKPNSMPPTSVTDCGSESRSSHGCWRQDRLLLDLADSSKHCTTHVPLIQLDERCHRGDHPRLVEGPGRQRHQCELRCSGPDRHGAVSERQASRGDRCDWQAESPWSYRIARGSCRCYHSALWRAEPLGQRPGTEDQWRYGLSALLT